MGRVKKFKIVMSKKEREVLCQVCKQETDTFNILPFGVKPENDREVWMACDNCTEQLGYFCSRHEKPHMGFEDGTTACKGCIDAQVDTEWQQIVSSFFDGVERSPKRREIIEAVHEWALTVSFVTGEPANKPIARAVVAVCQRFGKPVEDVIVETCERGAAVLLPWFYLDE